MSIYILKRRRAKKWDKDTEYVTYQIEDHLAV